MVHTDACFHIDCHVRYRICERRENYDRVPVYIRHTMRAPVNFLITTPESFDSLLCRHPGSFNDIKAVILDELHLLDNTYRGDQLRLLLKRLKCTAQTDFNLYVLSATISDPEEVACRYVKNFEIVKASGRREIDYTLVQSVREVFEQTRI
jgi:ATP-dependent Lhr-like helicase